MFSSFNKDSEFKKIWNNKCSKYNIKAQPHILPKVDRIIVIGDIHGDLEMCINTLTLAKVIDKDYKWCGGKTVIVQVGDQLDRCRFNNIDNIPCDNINATQNDEGNDWLILRYFTKLHQQAQKVGGAVYSLLGNHELMNVNGDMRYVSYKGLQEFKNFKYKNNNNEIVNYWINKNNKTNYFYVDGKTSRKWAFKPGNPVSEFLACTRHTAIIIGSNIFVHGGLLPSIVKKYNIKDLNNLMSLYLLNKIKDQTHIHNDIFGANDESPLWNRTFGNIGKKKYTNISEYLKERDTICPTLLNPLKELYKVDKIFIGHTPLLDDGIGSVCNKKIWLTDIGLSKAFDKYNLNKNIKHVQVLEILNDGKQINILK